LPVQTNEIDKTRPVDTDNQRHNGKGQHFQKTVRMHFCKRDWSGILGQFDIVVSHDLMQNKHRKHYQVNERIDFEEEPKKYRHSDLNTHDSVQNRFVDSSRSFNFGTPVTNVVDESHNQPQRQATVQNQVEQEYISRNLVNVQVSLTQWSCP
jgi:hypothetical protein